MAMMMTTMMIMMREKMGHVDPLSAIVVEEIIIIPTLVQYKTEVFYDMGLTNLAVPSLHIRCCLNPNIYGRIQICCHFGIENSMVTGLPFY